MRIAITGASGFVGGHLMRALLREGHDVAAISRRPMNSHPSDPHLKVHAVGLDDAEALARTMAGCDALAHCAGINLERGRQTYHRVHVLGTRNVMAAAKESGVKRIALVSFLRARPDCGSAYHESKWQAEQIVRASGLDYTVLKCGVIYGRGDHMLDHLSLALRSLPMFAFVGMRYRPVRPVAVADVVRILHASLIEGRLANVTVPAVGPETMGLSQAVRRVAAVLDRRPIFVRWPVWMHSAMARILENTMTVPIVSRAQVRILSEGIAEPVPSVDSLPDNLAPRIAFDASSIKAGLPEPRRLGGRDCRCVAAWCVEPGGN